MRLACLLVALASLVFGQQEQIEKSTYTLGPGDMIVVQALDMDEFGKESYPIDMRGNVSLPVAGRIHASGMTVEQLEGAIAERLKTLLKDPQVTVGLREMRSQPVSVLGSLKNPGVFQVQGDKSLLEMLSLAGGLSPEAGYSVRIARQKAWGQLPLPGAALDDTGQFWVAEVGVKEIMEAISPEKNIPVKPNDVITVPRGQMVYVMGAVKKSGGFVLGEREKTTALEALSMAEGTASYSKEGNAKILRKTSDPNRRLEISVDLAKVLKGQAKDVPMEADDILFVPTSKGKRALGRGAEAVISMGTGVVIYRR